jgi:hypothetical protein
MTKLANGTLFCVPLPDGTFLSGRVILDIYGCLKKRLFPADSPLPGLGKAYLVEMYAAVLHKAEHVPSELLIPGAFVESHAVGAGWPIIGNMPVDPQKVSFPESLIGFMHSTGEVAFECGELSVPLPLSHSELDRIGVSRSRHSAFLWPYTCLRVMGREEEVPRDYKMAYLTGSDLRYSFHRKEIYKLLPFSMEQSYFEIQSRLGSTLNGCINRPLR